MPKTRHSFSRDRCRDRKKRKRKTDLCMGLSNWQQCFVCQSQICYKEKRHHRRQPQYRLHRASWLYTSSKDYCVQESAV